MAFQDTLLLPLEVLLPVIAAIASFSVAAVYTGWVAKQKPGTKEMLEISSISFVPGFCLETQAAKPPATAKEAIAATIGRSSEISILYLQCLYVVNINHQAKIFS